MPCWRVFNIGDQSRDYFLLGGRVSTGGGRVSTGGVVRFWSHAPIASQLYSLAIITTEMEETTTSSSEEEKRRPKQRKKVNKSGSSGTKQCYMHQTSVQKENIQDFTKTRWETYRSCVTRWLCLDGENQALAQTYKHCIDLDFDHVPEDAGFHATCYRRFIDKNHIALAEKRCSKKTVDEERDAEVVGGPSDTTSAAESPRKKLRSRTGLPVPSAGPVLPAICIICKKVDKRVTVGSKRQRDTLSRAETISAGKG